MLETLLQRLGLEPSEQATYQALLDHGSLQASVLAKRTGANRATQYLFLKRLIEKGFVTQSLKQGLKVFTAEPPEKLLALYDEKIALLQQDQKLFQELLPLLQAKQGEKLITPKFQIFEGADGLKQVLKDMLLYHDMETQAYWPIKKMIEILSPEFFRIHNIERIKRHLYTRAIWPKSEQVDLKTHPYLGVGEEFEREIRLAPPGINFTMGYWIYGNKVAFLSSRKEQYGYIIESAELAEMLLSQFDLMWNASRPLKVNDEDTRAFLESLERR